MKKSPSDYTAGERKFADLVAAVKAGKPNAQRAFEIRHATLRHIAHLSPNRVSVADIAGLTNAHLRTAQRALKQLKEWGYLTADSHNPIGYKFNEEKRKELGL